MAAGQIRGRGIWVQDQGWLQVTGAGALGRGRDFPCKIHSNRWREPDPREGIGTAKGPQRGPQLKGWGKRDGRQQGVEGGERRVLRAKGKEAGGFPSCFHRLSQASLHAPPQWS